MKCLRCQHENPPGSNFCPGCGTRLSATCGVCGNDLPAGSRFCNKCGTPVSGESAGQVRFASPESYTPRHLAERILTSKVALEGERKQVTVLFGDLKGSMELLADRDPEEARKILDPVLELMMEAVHHFEGTVNQVMGDGIMALFGAPIAHEDHAVRACYTALRMHESLNRYAENVRRTHGVNVQIRVGLNSGEVVVRAIGSDLHMDYTAVGQTTHLAARMEQLALPGSILLTPSTLGLVEGYVAVKPLGPVPVKGLAEAVEVYEVMGAGAARTRLQASAARGLTRFVGRDTEVERLCQALENAQKGHGQVVSLVGEPGVGKSRLFYEFTRSHRTHGWLVLESGSVSYGKATPYLPLIDLLKNYFKIDARDEARAIRVKVTGNVLTLDESLKEAVTPTLWLLEALPPDDPFLSLDPPQRRRLTLDAIKRILLRESRVQPLLLVFEDLHWIDSETQAFLDSLIDSLPATQLLLFVNYRPEYRHGWGGKSYYTQLRVDTLPPESAQELLLGLVGNDATLEPLKRFLIERTEGNPFFLEESVRSLVETQVLVGERGAYRLAGASPSVQVPATVQAILAARIDRLEPELKQILQTAAVIGKDVPFVLLQAVADSADEHLRHGLSRLQTGEFLYETSLFPDLGYTFKHALTHEVAYGSLVGDRRRALHARIVDALVRLFPDRLMEHVERLAQHAVRAEMWEDAVAYLPEAAAKAVGRGANKEAVLYFDEALHAIGKLPEARASVERVIDLRLELRNTLLALVDLPRALDCVREAETCAVSLGDRERLARVLTHKTHSLWLVGEYEGAIDAGQEALTLAREIGDFSLTVAATQYLGQVYRTVGDYPQAIALFRRNIAATEGRRTTERLGMHALPAVLSRGFLSDCLSLTGEFAEGAIQGRDAQRIAEAAGHPFSIVSAYGASVLLYVRKGDLDIAIPLLIRTLDLCRVWNVGIWVPETTAALGLAYALAGRRDEALVVLEEVVHQIFTRVFTGPAVAAVSQAYLLTGNVEIAARIAKRALNADWIRKQPGSLAWLLYILGEVATSPEWFDAKTGEAHYREALVLAEPRGMRPLIAHCHLGLGRLYRRTDKRDQAQEHLGTATAMYRETNMRFWLEKAEAEQQT